MIAFIANNHQYNCEITRVTSVLYRPLKTKMLGQHICTKHILPLRVQNSPTAFPQLPPMGGSKVAFINPTS